MADEPKTVIVERSRGSNATPIIAIIALLILAVGGYFLLQSQDNKNDAVSTAASQVGDAAQDVGDAAQSATGAE
ncbi:MAG: hypothetical protein KKD64_00860 [Alphaproteobacteria bacterium]|nr:hypothetical protein [Alphaproteobacteria bacterium]MBU0793568.1 hypothetical protein [Alphaproteobacteria bacterium]MBU0876265.1 hypothetical protein [Alphaproteobacteria bacterium]MBU1768190.1 hypothetical protein [Alphaproteobacteria bacterium]